MGRDWVSRWEERTGNADGKGLGEQMGGTDWKCRWDEKMGRDWVSRWEEQTEKQMG